MVALVLFTFQLFTRLSTSMSMGRGFQFFRSLLIFQFNLLGFLSFFLSTLPLSRNVEKVRKKSHEFLIFLAINAIFFFFQNRFQFGNGLKNYKVTDWLVIKSFFKYNSNISVIICICFFKKLCHRFHISHLKQLTEYSVLTSIHTIIQNNNLHAKNIPQIKFKRNNVIFFFKYRI